MKYFCKGRVAFVSEKRFLSFVFHERWWWTGYRLPGSIILESHLLSHDKAENSKLAILAIRCDNAKMSQNTLTCCVPSMPIICFIERRMIIMCSNCFNVPVMLKIVIFLCLPPTRPRFIDVVLPPIISWDHRYWNLNVYD